MTSSRSGALVSVVVAALDEAKVLPGLWARLGPVLDEVETRGLRTEVVLVNDGSTDDTLAVMRALQSRDTRVRIVDLTRRFGHQAALVAGIDHARGELIAVLDADLQDPPELIPELVARWEEGYDVAYGVRQRRRGDSLFKRATARGFYRVLSWLAGDWVREGVGDFAVFDRAVARAALTGQPRRPFLRGALAQTGYRHIGVPYDRSPRLAGSTKYPLRRMFALAVDAVTSLTILPLRLASALGVLTIAMAAVVALVATPWWVAVLLGVSGVQLLTIGMLGEYVGRIHERVSGRPLYLVRDVVEAEPDQSTRGGQAV